MEQLHSPRQLLNKSGAPHLQVQLGSLLPQFPLGSLSRCCPDWPFVTKGVTLGNGGVRSFQILTLQLLPLPMKWVGFFFSPVLPASTTSCPGASSTSGHLCVVIMYKGPGWLRGGGVRLIFCPLVLLPQCSCTLFKGTCTGTGNVPHFLTHHPPALLPIYPPFSVFLYLPCFVSPGPPPFTLF